MSTAYSMGCKKCKVDLNIGCRQHGENRLYKNDVHDMEALEYFLFSHAGHGLEFNIDDVFADNNSESVSTQELLSEKLRKVG